jgi:ribosomal protein S27AE
MDYELHAGDGIKLLKTGMEFNNMPLSVAFRLLISREGLKIDASNILRRVKANGDCTWMLENSDQKPKAFCGLCGEAQTMTLWAGRLTCDKCYNYIS